jgi:gliding motility-associated-like protein
LGDTVFVLAVDTSNIASYLWGMGDGTPNLDQSSFTYVYTSPPDLGYFDVSLLIISPDGCPLPITSDTPIYVYHSNANITLTDTAGCSPFEVIMSSATSENDDSRFWTINGNSFGSGQESENHTFENNTAEDILYTIGLTTTIEPYGCQDSKDTTITVYALPQIITSADTTICKGDAISIYATGGSIYTWTPDISISDSTIQSPVVNPETDITYLVDVENIYGCHNTDSVHIIVQQDFDVTVTPAIDSIVIGDTVYSVLVATQENLTYSWSPTDFASCVDCPMPYFIPEESMRYTVTVEDSAKCFRYSYYIDIIVREEYTLDVPGAFTPLSANGNSVVYADGFVIRKLLQFRIYNRWGEEVFYTDDITKGWNGYYNGQLQNIDTYSYYVEAEMFDGTTQSKKGHIMLIR